VTQIVIGAGAAGQRAAAELLAAGITDFTILDKPGHHVVAAVFDDGTDTWALQTAAGETFRAGVVVAAHRQVGQPWIPEFLGCNDFRGISFHAARWDNDFDPAGKRIAVIGADATAGHYIGQLMHSAASVAVFALPPRRFVPEIATRITLARRRLLRHARRAAGGEQPKLVGAAIDAVTPSGIRTDDGVDHRVDAIIYGTGFATPEAALVGARGLTIQQAWRDGMEPFLGVACHGFPNYFFVTGPDIAAQASYVAACLRLMRRTASTRIEVRRSTQQVFNERIYLKPAQPHPVASAFDLSTRGDTEIYDGAATLTVAGTGHPVRVRLTGHLDPIDGHYHWQGTVFSSQDQPLPNTALRQARTATLTVGQRSAPARIVEQTPWGTHAVAGVGAPPYPAPTRSFEP
jgi:cation diffusion facilitator CzcD-associated flavoprotein CzcO